MVKTKYVGIAGVFLAVFVVAGVFFWIGQRHGQTAEGLNARQTAVNDDEEQSSNSAGGLAVNAGTSPTNLGQLGGGQNSSNGSTQGASSGGSSSSSSSLFDPKTFAQYEKYKDDKAGLFGEVQVGSGAELTAGHKAAVLYKGWLTNGQLFDESKAGSDGKLQPFVFTLGEHQVIPGWEQGINGMKTGGVRLLIVPPAVGYGANGQGPIPGNAVLIFQVQLLEVQ